MTMPNLKPTEMLLVLLVVLLLFGSKRLPDLARSVGKSLNILKSEAKAANDDAAPASPAEAGKSSAAPLAQHT